MSAPAGGAPERTKAANRAAILAAAREVFSATGYEAASVRDIVRRTELASGTFYNYFPDKASIFRALVEDTGGEARRRVRAARRGAGSGEAFVEDGFRAFFAFIAEDPETFAFLRRNLGTIREQFDDAVLPAGLRRARGRPARRDRARRRCRRWTSSTARTRWSRSRWSWDSCSWPGGRRTSRAPRRSPQVYFRASSAAFLRSFND